MAHVFDVMAERSTSMVDVIILNQKGKHSTDLVQLIEKYLPATRIKVQEWRYGLLFIMLPLPISSRAISELCAAKAALRGISYEKYDKIIIGASMILAPLAISMRKHQATIVVKSHDLLSRSFLSTAASMDNNIAKRLFYFKEGVGLRLIERWLARTPGIAAVMLANIDELMMFKRWSGARKARRVSLRPFKVALPRKVYNIPEVISGINILFCGVDNILNRQALIWLKNKVWPRLTERDPGKYRLMILGTIGKFFSQYDGFSDMGFVEDMDDVYRDCHLVVIPIQSGSGVKTKFLDAVMRMRPVVSTPLGAEGVRLPAKGKVLAVTADPVKFANAIRAISVVLERRPLLMHDDLATNARFIKTNYGSTATV